MSIHNTAQAVAVIQAAKVVLDSLDNSSLTFVEAESVREAGRALNRATRSVQGRLDREAKRNTNT